MIQAQNPEQLQNNTNNTPTVSQVYGFSSPVSPQLPINQKNEKIHFTPEWQKTFFHWWHKIALALLIVHGLIGLWESIYFMAVEYPALNELLAVHQVDVLEVNHLISRAIITTLATLVTIFFAIRLSKVTETTAHNIDLVVATTIILTTTFIQNYLSQLDLLNYFLGILSQ